MSFCEAKFHLAQELHSEVSCSNYSFVGGFYYVNFTTLLHVAKNSDKCVGGAKWKPFSSPVNATLVLVGDLGKCF